jgi:alpha-1,3-rhamnosyl/mannosyltransferase
LLRTFAAIDPENEYAVFNFFFREYAKKLEHVYCPEAPNFRRDVRRWPESIVARAEWNWKIPWIERHLAARGTDVYHAARVPATARVPVVYTSQDLLYVAHPERMYPEFKWGWEAAGRPGLDTASRIIVTSEHHRREMAELLRVDERKIRVIPSGANTETFHPVGDPAILRESKSRWRLPERFLLMIGPFDRWWCRYDESFRAFQAASSDHPELRLVLAGSQAHPEVDRLKSLAAELKIDGKLLWLGNVPPPELNLVANQAIGNIYPAWDSGSSINVLDSMAAGLPVITAPVSCLPEMLGDAGVWADSASPAELERAMRRLVEDGDFRRKTSETGLSAARARTWEATARATLAVYREVVR